MQVGDLVKCLTGSCGTGIIVDVLPHGLYGVILNRNGRVCCFQAQHLEVICK